MLAGSIFFTVLFLAHTLVLLVVYWGQPYYDGFWLVPAFMTTMMFAVSVGAFIGLRRQQ